MCKDFPFAQQGGRHVGEEASYYTEATRRHLATAMVFEDVPVTRCHAAA